MEKLLLELQSYLSKVHPKRIFTVIPEIVSHLRSQASELERVTAENQKLREFYDRHHEDRSGDYTAYVDLRPGCECVPCKYSRGIIKHLQDLCQSERDKTHIFQAERDELLKGYREMREALEATNEEIKYWYGDYLSEKDMSHPWSIVYAKNKQALSQLSL